MASVALQNTKTRVWCSMANATTFFFQSKEINLLWLVKIFIFFVTALLITWRSFTVIVNVTRLLAQALQQSVCCQTSYDSLVQLSALPAATYVPHTDHVYSFATRSFSSGISKQQFKTVSSSTFHSWSRSPLQVTSADTPADVLVVESIY